MKIVRHEAAEETRIAEYESRGAYAIKLGEGRGEGHVYRIRFEKGGRIGRHAAGFDQLFIVIEGAGWAAGADGTERPLRTGDSARFSRGEMHSKGSESGMTALMVQMTELNSGDVAS